MSPQAIEKYALSTLCLFLRVFCVYTNDDILARTSRHMWKFSSSLKNSKIRQSIIKNRAMKKTTTTPIKVSKYFSSSPPKALAERGEDENGNDQAASATTMIKHDSFLECVRAAEVDFQFFLEAAKVKADYARHERGLEMILRHAEGVMEAKKDFFEREKEERRRERRKRKKDVVCIDLGFGEGEGVLGVAATENYSEEARARKRLGQLLKNTLEELHRLHVNASCRCSTRAPRVKEARDKLTSYRRRAREAYKTVDFDRYENDLREQFERKRKREETDAFAKFHRNPPKSIEEIRNCCELFVRNGRSPHHLCPHLCYYREYEPARQLFVLRIACCEKFGSAKKLEGWTSELALNTNINNNNNSSGGGIARGVNSPSPRKESSAAQLSSYATDNLNSVLGSGYKSFPWKVEFKNPSGETFDTAEDVMKAISGDEGDNNKQAAKTNPQGISFPRSSHGGSGKRLPGVKEHGLEQDVEILRAALWKASDDQVHASSPVKLRRLEAEKEGYERSPMQLAPPGKGFVESCGDVVTLKVIDYNNENDEDEEGRMFSESDYDLDGEYGASRRRTREDATRYHHQEQDAFDGFFCEDEEGDDDDEIIAKKEEEEKKVVEEVRVKEEPVARDQENDENRNVQIKKQSVKKERKVRATCFASEEASGEEKKLRLTQLNETKMKHSYHSSKLLKLESEPPLVSKFDEEDAANVFFARDEESDEQRRHLLALASTNADEASLERKSIRRNTARQQPSVSGSRHFVVPPRSPFGLLEEILWRDDWKLLTACMMLNCTTRLQVDRVLWELFTLAPTAEDAVKLGETERGIELIEKCLATIGLHRKRARAFVRLSKDVVEARRGKESALLRLEEEDRGDEQILAMAGGENRESLPPSPNAARATGDHENGDDVNDNDDLEENPPPSAPTSGGGKFVRSVSEFHGVGAYAADAHAMFCDGVIAAPPRDHALRWYYAFALERESEKLSKNVLFLKETNVEKEEGRREEALALGQ